MQEVNYMRYIWLKLLNGYHWIKQANKKKSTTFETIETERLILRSPIACDEKPLYQLINHSLQELQKWMLWASDSASIKRYVKRARKNNLARIVVHKQSQKIIGLSGFNPQSHLKFPIYEIGIWFDIEYAGLGLATETVQALTKFAFESFKAQKVQILTQADNIAMRRVAEKCGFTLEATLRKNRIDCLSGLAADDCIFVRFDANGL